jgi:effector-binding domain-containing protein/DNA-binding transcriptional MerR regulator
MALKDLGFSLAQVAALLDEEVPTAQLEGMLKLRQAEVQELIRAEQGRLERIEARLGLIQQEKEMPSFQVTFKDEPARRIVSLHWLINRTLAEQGNTLPRLFEHWAAHAPAPAGMEMLPGLFKVLRQHLADHGHTPSQVIVLAHDRELSGENVALEIAAVVDGPVEESDEVKVSELPAAKLACAPHSGSLASFMEAYQALSRWIEQNAYTISGPTRDTALDTETGGGARFEIQIPVEKA